MKLEDKIALDAVIRHIESMRQERQDGSIELLIVDGLPTAIRRTQKEVLRKG